MCTMASTVGPPPRPPSPSSAPWTPTLAKLYARSTCRRPSPPSLARLPRPAPPIIAPPPAAAGASRLAVQLGRVLKRKREGIGLTLGQAASLSGINLSDIASYEGGGKTPFDHALILARILGISPGELPGMHQS